MEDSNVLKERIAVIDTETTWDDTLLSLGVVIARGEDYTPIDRRYYILLPAKFRGGMFSDALYVHGVEPDRECTRREVMKELLPFLAAHGVERIFAYNAMFDQGHLPELSAFAWYDIMRLAAYRQYNPSISADAECFRTGRLKRGYGVEPILRMLSGRWDYAESHNALLDARDELSIMKLLGLPLSSYAPAKL